MKKVSEYICYIVLFVVTWVVGFATMVAVVKAGSWLLVPFVFISTVTVYRYSNQIIYAMFNTDVVTADSHISNLDVEEKTESTITIGDGTSSIVIMKADIVVLIKDLLPFIPGKEEE